MGSPYEDIYIDMVIVLSSVLFGSYKASSCHEALMFKSHHNTPVTRNVSISQSWIVRWGGKGQRYVTFNRNMRHHTKVFLFLFSFTVFSIAKCQRPLSESIWLLELQPPNPSALLAFFIYLFRLGCLDSIKRLIVEIREDCIVVKVQSAWLIAAAAAGRFCGSLILLLMWWREPGERRAVARVCIAGRNRMKAAEIITTREGFSFSYLGLSLP